MGPASSSERHEPREPPPGDPIPEALRNSPDYEVIRELNRGAMGVVYLVRNRRMDRLECLKIVNAELLKRSGSRERFEREIRSAARVNHPHIVVAYSAPTLEGMLAFAMEYVDGIDLARLVAARGPLPISNACYYAQQVAKALHYAHEKSLVHRDIKPGNLILARDGHRETIKILDFGLAKATSESPSDGALTETGQMLGTPQFMAPEQIKDAGKADIRADIYSLGCTLYFLLTGTAPFQNKSGLYELLHAQQFETARPLNEVRKDVPAELAGVVAKMTAKDPLDRYQQPGDAAAALAPFFTEGLKEISFDWDAGKPNVPAPSLAMGGADTEAAIKARKPEPPAAAPAAAVTAPHAAVMPTLIDDAAARSPQPVPGGPLNSPARNHPNRGRPRRLWGRVAVVLLLAVVAGLWWTGIIDVKTRYGTLVLEVNEPKPAVYVDGVETEVTWDDSGKKAEIRVETGNRRVEVSKDGFSVATKELEFKEGESQTFKARLMPMPTVANSGVPTTMPDTGTPGKPNGGTPDTVTPATVPATTPTTAPADFDGKSAGQERDDNGLAIKFMWCPAGEFTMGSPRTEKDRGVDEEPVRVMLTKGFWLGKNEVTQAQWTRLMGTTPWKGEVNVQDGPDFPVTFVNWQDVMAFCGKLTAQELAAGRLAKGSEYVLPTEAQWEYACRAGSKSTFSFGDDAKRLAEFGWFKTNSIDAGQKFAHAVSQKQPNPWGMHDMHGNVFEWCRDVFIVKLKGGNDPFVAAGGSQHVYRGGGWFNTPQYCRSAIRRGLDPSFRGNALGFRVACIKAAGG